METVTTVPADASFQQLLMMFLVAAIPVLIAYLEKLRRDLQNNTIKTESINHAVNGSFDKRLLDLARNITSDIGEALAENYSNLEKRLDDFDQRLADLERKART